MPRPSLWLSLAALTLAVTPGVLRADLVDELLKSNSYATLADGSRAPEKASKIEVKRDGKFLKASICNQTSAPLKISEVTLFDFEHKFPAVSRFYGEGFTMLSQTGGTLAAPVDIGGYADREHYRIAEPAGFRAVYGMTTITPPEGETLLAGFTSCRRFVGKFYVNTERLRIVVNTEGLTLPGGATWELEELLIAAGSDRNALLEQLADRLNKNHPRQPSPELPTGWCSWYCFGPRVTDANITSNLAVIEKRIPALKFIQIDDGYQPSMGDWLETGEAFGGDVQDVLVKIKQQGFEPAIWVAPFIASPESKLFAEHPDWFVKDAQGQPLPSDKFTFGGWRQGPWYMLDGTHPVAQQYLETVFRTMREEWGCTYFKLDANVWGAFPEGVRHDPQASSVEAYRQGMAAIRRGAGDSFLLGCNHAMWPSIGEIHGSRSSRDVNRSWKTFTGVAQDNLHRNWQNNRLWWNDPDCFVLSGKPSDNEKSFHIAAAYATGGMLLSGDDLTKASDQDFEILKRLAANPGVAADFNAQLTEGWIHAGQGETVVFLNWQDENSQRQIKLDQSRQVIDLVTGEDLGVHSESFSITLPGRSGRVLKLTRAEAELTGAAAHAVSEKVRQFGSPRDRAPADWPSFDWEKKRKLLFGMYAPTADEKQLIEAALPGRPSASVQKKPKLLVFYRCQYPHASIATGNYAFQRLGEATGAYEATLTDDPTMISAEHLANYDALLLNNTTNWDKTVGAAGRKAILDFVARGNGLIGIHAAADSCRGWRDGIDLIGGRFQCHPWTPAGTWAFQLESPKHPLNAAFDGQGFWLRDEIYYYQDGTHSPGKSRDLISLDMTKQENAEGKHIHENLKELTSPQIPHPVAWIHAFGQGRVFYSNLGHNNTTYWQPKILKHYLDGIQYALDTLPANATPSAQVDNPTIAPAPAK